MGKHNNNKGVFYYTINALRLFFWPRGGWRRTARYMIKQMRRMPSSPYALSIGFSAGVFASFTPFLGFHFLLAALIAWIVRGNIVASALGTVVGNPLTFPFIWVIDYILGFYLLNDKLLSWGDVKLPNDIQALGELFYPILIGSLLAGLVGGFIAFILIYFFITFYRKRKQND